MRRWPRLSALVCMLTICILPNGSAFAGDKFNKSDCTANGKKLYGKIKLVTSFPDVKVQVVKSFPDVKVQRVGSFPDKCGKWQLVTDFPDTKVQLVDSFSDVKVQYVDSFPGIP